MTPGKRIYFRSPGGQRYTLTFPVRWRHEDCDGYFDQKRRQISINPAVSEERMRELLFHELLHLSAFPVHPPQTQEQGIEEIIVLTFETNMFRLLRNNPALTDLLFPSKGKP